MRICRRLRLQKRSLRCTQDISVHVSQQSGPFRCNMLIYNEKPRMDDAVIVNIKGYGIVSTFVGALQHFQNPSTNVVNKTQVHRPRALPRSPPFHTDSEGTVKEFFRCVFAFLPGEFQEHSGKVGHFFRAQVGQIQRASKSDLARSTESHANRRISVYL